MSTCMQWVAAALTAVFGAACGGKGHVQGGAGVSASPPGDTFVVPAGDARSDQAVDARETWFVHTGAQAAGDGASSDTNRTLWLTPLTEAPHGIDANASVAAEVVVDVAGASGQLGTLLWAPPVFSADSQYLALGAPAQLVTLGANPVAVALPADAPAFALALAFSADSRAVAAACGDRRLRVWAVGGAPQAPLQEVDLSAVLPPATQLSSASLVSMGENLWRLAVVGDRLPPRIIDVNGGVATLADLGTYGVLPETGAQVAIDPASYGHLFLLGLGSGTSLISRLLRTSPPFANDIPVIPPALAVGATHAQYSANASLLVAAVTFQGPTGTPQPAYRQVVVWHLPDGGVSWQGATGAVPLTGNVLTASGRLYLWAASPAAPGTVGIWQM